MSAQVRRHRPAPDRVHHEWDLDLPPVLEVDSGDELELELRMARHGELAPGSPFDPVGLDPGAVYHLAGPVRVAGARPGTVLRVDVLELAPGPWGWSAILPGEGLLSEDFPSPAVRFFDLADPTHIDVAPGVAAAADPFLGTMGVHPGVPRRAPVFPPHPGGGNMDTRHLGVGSTLWLPVHVEGGLFSCGDPHALQGDGEVCVTALECAMGATLRVTVECRRLDSPVFSSPPRADPRGAQGQLGTMGIGSDLYAGAQDAVRAMIALLADTAGLNPEDAYVACSLLGDLRILEIVDDGVFVVGMLFPRSVLS